MARGDLRNFQQQILQRLQDPGAAARAAGHLGFMAGGISWLVDVAVLKEVASPPPIMPVGRTRGWFLGVANVRGELHCVSDLAALAGGAPTSRAVHNRVLLVHDELMRSTGLLVERVLGLRDLARCTRLPVTAQAAPWVAAEYQDETGMDWSLLDVRTLVADPAFMEIAA